jgi:hypothetical protein
MSTGVARSEGYAVAIDLEAERRAAMKGLITDEDIGLRESMVDARSGAGLGIFPRVENVATLAEEEPILLVQRYCLGKMVYQVVRKQTSPHQHFSVSGDLEITLSGALEIDRELRWWGELTAANTDAKRDLFAVIFVNEDDGLVHTVFHLEDGHPHALIRYDPDARVFCCEPAVTPNHGYLAAISSPNLDTAIRRTVVELDAVLQKHWWELEPWQSASWSERLGLLWSAYCGPILLLVMAILIVVICRILWGTPSTLDPNPPFPGM